MKNFDFVFVVLVYRNTKDLEDFNESLKKVNGTYKVVLVESFYDRDTTEKFSNIAQKYGYDFIPVENKGYSFGNNTGILYAYKNYDFEYIIISNADIIVNTLDIDYLNNLEFDVMGPKIIRKDGKNQNPLYIKKTFFNTHYLYYVFKKFNKLKFYLYIFMYKLENCIYTIFKRNNSVYAIHGSFIILRKKAIETLNCKPFDENMFLFSEENVLAYKCKEKNLKVIYDKSTSVYHKEDGSINLNENIKSFKLIVESFIYFYEKYIQKKKIKI